MSNPYPPNPDINAITPVFSIRTFLAILGAVVLAVILTLLVVPILVPGLAASLTSSEGEGYWYLSRVSGFVAYLLLWASMMMGLVITDRLARLWPGGPAAYDLHQYFSIIGIAFTLFHMLILLGSKYIGYSLVQLLVPFTGAQYRPLWIGIGQLSFYLALVVTFTFYARSWFGPKGWRRLHYLSFAFFLFALLHSAYSGTDTTSFWAGPLYWVTGGATLFFSVYRIVFTLTRSRQRITR